METIRKFYCFLCICAAVLAAIGGTAYLFYGHRILFGVLNLALSAMAVPYVVARVKELLK